MTYAHADACAAWLIQVAAGRKRKSAKDDGAAPRCVLLLARSRHLR